MPVFALLHSIFLSPLIWRGVGAELAASGGSVRLLDYRDVVRNGGSYYDHAAQVVADQLPRQAVLVAHSAAGALAPSIVAASEGSLAGVVFVDALLPHPGRSWLETAPQLLKALITEGVADDDRVPPWPRLLPPPVLARLVPDVAMRSTLIEESPSVPLSLLRERAPALDLPSELNVAYVQLSDSYDSEAQAARERGWRVLRLAGDHLWPLTHAVQVAKTVRDTVASLGC
ncbi:MAG TPA: hypothetical protein VK801_04170 [Caulobacteraceae bacterium]|nr:hypothetical protein [Caulobacteraceae bacterium]